MAIDQEGVENPNEMPSLGTRSSALTFAMGMAYGGRRDYYHNFGWDRSPEVKDYYAAYLRNPYANAVISIPAKTAWRQPPQIEDTKDTETDEQTQFEEDVEEFVSSTRLWHYCQRAHLLSRIGEFGVLMIGWADGEDRNFAQPVDGAALAKNDPDEAVHWLRPFSQLSVKRIRWADANSGRWGQPEYYRIDFSDENNNTTEGVFGAGQSEQWVHHSRIVHVAGGLLDDEVRGTPALEAVYNAVCDLEKVSGSAAESAYAIARPGISVNIDKDANASDQDKLDIYDETADYVDENQNFLVLQGAEAERISAETVDPSKIKDMLIEELSAKTTIPQKKFKGNESGEIAGAQDLREFYGTIQEEREQTCGPQLAREIFQQLKRYTVVASPEGGDFEVNWDPLAEQDEKEESEIQSNRSTVAKNVAPYTGEISSAAWAEFIETGEFPEIDDLSDGPEPMDPAEDAGAPPASTQPPAIADGGEQEDDG